MAISVRYRIERKRRSGTFSSFRVKASPAAGGEADDVRGLRTEEIDLTPEDEEILDKVWDAVGRERQPKTTLSEVPPPPIDDTVRTDVMAIIRETFFSNTETCDRDQAIREIARALGDNRVGNRIEEILGNDIRTAVRRKILSNEGKQYSLYARSIEDYSLDHLVDMLVASLDSGWQTRDDATMRAARHLGFRRSGARIRAAFKSAINAGVRRGLIERDGTKWIRRVR